MRLNILDVEKQTLILEQPLVIEKFSKCNRLLFDFISSPLDFPLALYFNYQEIKKDNCDFSF